MNVPHNFVLFALLAGCWVGACPAKDPPAFGICVPNIELPPLSFDNGRQGTLRKILGRAVALAQVKIAYQVAPIRRCHELVRNGVIPATLVSFTESTRELFSFPPDASDGRAPGSQITPLAVAVYRRQGSRARWTGSAFLNTHSVGVLHDALAIKQALAHSGVRVDDNNHTAEQQIRKLEAGRFDLLLAIPGHIAPYLAESRVERLPESFATYKVYLALSLRLDSQQRHAGEQLWRALSTMNQLGEITRLLQASPAIAH